MSNPTDPSLYAMQQATLAAAERTAAALERIADAMESKSTGEVAGHEVGVYGTAGNCYVAMCECGWQSSTYARKYRYVAEKVAELHMRSVK